MSYMNLNNLFPCHPTLKTFSTDNLRIYQQQVNVRACNLEVYLFNPQKWILALQIDCHLNN